MQHDARRVIARLGETDGTKAGGRDDSHACMEAARKTMIMRGAWIETCETSTELVYTTTTTSPCLRAHDFHPLPSCSGSGPQYSLEAVICSEGVCSSFQKEVVDDAVDNRNGLSAEVAKLAFVIEGLKRVEAMGTRGTSLACS